MVSYVDLLRKHKELTQEENIVVYSKNEIEKRFKEEVFTPDDFKNYVVRFKKIVDGWMKLKGLESRNVRELMISMPYKEIAVTYLNVYPNSQSFSSHVDWDASTEDEIIYEVSYSSNNYEDNSVYVISIRVELIEDEKKLRTWVLNLLEKGLIKHLAREKVLQRINEKYPDPEPLS